MRAYRGAKMPGLLLGVLDGGSLEMRILRLIEGRLPWARRWRVVSAVGCVVVMAAVCVGALMFGVRTSAAQSAGAGVELLHASGPVPSFEVATIKPSDGNFHSATPPWLLPQNVVNYFNTTTRTLIGQAYGMLFGLEGSRVIGGPGWIDDKRYNIEGKIPDAIFDAEQKMTPGERKSQTQLMQQSLLAERFKLKVHFEMRELPVYEVMVAKGGPKLTPAKNPGPALATPPPPPPAPGNFPKPQDMRQGLMVIPSGQGREMVGKGVTLDQVFAHPFFGMGGRPIMDKTGLMGKYDFTLDWTPDQPTVPGDASSLREAHDNEISIFFAAVEKQLGLKLVPTKAPVEVVVIDSIELPSEN